MYHLVRSDERAIDTEHEKKILLEIHGRDRQAHFATDVEEALATIPDTQIYVREGKIFHHTRSDIEKTLSGYFQNTTFLEWDDLEPPIVHVSNDGTMAWMVNRLGVTRIIRDMGGNEEERRFVYAGITVYEKKGDTWFKVANASTFE